LSIFLIDVVNVVRPPLRPVSLNLAVSKTFPNHYQGTWGYRRVVAAFGQSILDPDGASIDREKLGALAFGDPTGRLRRKLNAATHLPILLSLIRSILRCWLSCKLIAVVDMPLLYESGFWIFARPRVLVTCDGETQVRRVMLRDSLSEESARARVAAQAPPGPKASRSHCVIENNEERGVEELKKRVSEILVWGQEGEEEERRHPKRRRRRRGLLFRNCLWHALLTPPALAVAMAVVVALCLTKAR